MRKTFIWLLFIGCVFSTSLYAQESANPVLLPQAELHELRLYNTTQVEEVVDPLRVKLVDNTIVQLSTIDIPDMDSYDPGEITIKALALMKQLLDGKQVRLYQTKRADKGRENRMGHHLGHITVQNGQQDVWVQGALLVNGLAIVRPSGDNPEMATEMLALQLDAQKEKRGYWANEENRIRTPEDAAGAMNKWTTVEGTIYSAAVVNNTIYLNFAQDWRKDFTVGIASDVRRKFAATGMNPMNMGGQTVRVHGWMESYNGPFIKLIDPAWIEILPDSSL